MTGVDQAGELPVRMRALLDGPGSLLPGLLPDESAVADLARSHGVCVRPIALKVTDTGTGETSIVSVPCGARLAVKCEPCAERARKLRVWQCLAGWHLDDEPGTDTDDGVPVDRASPDVNGALTAAGQSEHDQGDRTTRRVRSTRRRQDAPDLPSMPMAATTLGRVYETAEGKRFRPSMFVTLTLPSYGRVHPDGTPEDPGSYDYDRAARDAIVFGRLVDRFVQNLRRVAGYKVQYFAAVEPQRRLAMHVHFAIRGTTPRRVIRQVVAATYHQVWGGPTPPTCRSCTRLGIGQPGIPRSTTAPAAMSTPTPMRR